MTLGQHGFVPSTFVSAFTGMNFMMGKLNTIAKIVLQVLFEKKD